LLQGELLGWELWRSELKRKCLLESRVHEVEMRKGLLCQQQQQTHWFGVWLEE
jgi:hypothetical protein